MKTNQKKKKNPKENIRLKRKTVKAKKNQLNGNIEKSLEVYYFLYF